MTPRRKPRRSPVISSAQKAAYEIFRLRGAWETIYTSTKIAEDVKQSICYQLDTELRSLGYEPQSTFRHKKP